MGQKLSSKPGGEAYLIHLSPVLHFMQKHPPEVFCEKKMFLEVSQNSQENTCARKHLENTRKHLGLQLY